MSKFEKIVYANKTSDMNYESYREGILKRSEDIPNREDLFNIGDQALIVVEKLADLYKGGINLKFVTLAATQTVSACLTAALAHCEILPPPTDIEMKMDSSGTLIYRCSHNPPHEWDLDGRRIR